LQLNSPTQSSITAGTLCPPKINSSFKTAEISEGFKFFPKIEEEEVTKTSSREFFYSEIPHNFVFLVFPSKKLRVDF
jgi:hypothetical protein